MPTYARTLVQFHALRIGKDNLSAITPYAMIVSRRANALYPTIERYLPSCLVLQSIIDYHDVTTKDRECHYVPIPCYKLLSMVANGRIVL